jgi:hypothetical protein
MRKFLNVPASAIGVLLVAVSVFGQSNLAQSNGAATNSVQTDEAEMFEKKNELSIRGGFAPIGLTNLRRSNFGFAAVRYSRRIAGNDSVALKYTFDAVPLAVLDYEKQRVIQTGATTFAVERASETVYGAGITPVGFQLNLRRRSKIQPFVAANAGLLVFSKAIPDDRTLLFPDRKGTRLNFVTGAGGGVEFVHNSERSYTVGYQFQHISNASRGNINPGFNQNLFYVGYTFNKW